VYYDPCMLRFSNKNFLATTILQNIAARNPRLSGHLRPQVVRTVEFRWPASSWLSVLPLFSSFTHAKLASLTEREAYIMQGPLVSERPKFRPWYSVEGRGERRSGILVVLLVDRGKIDISGLISSFPHCTVRAWRMATHRRVRSLQRRRRHG
jgi:hypothetical protein